MSAFALQTIHHGRRLALLAVVVALAFGAMVLVWATTGDTAGAPEPTSRTYTHPLDSNPGGPVTDAGVNPWEASDPALVAP
jgi:hypothetical protein